jgi:pSer/pThr/pTyr-binding forkhead associated (FHA) protein
LAWNLEVFEGPDKGLVISLRATPVNIGRDASSSQLILSDTAASRLHARVTLTEGDVVSIEDLGSSHGTYLNSQKLSGIVHLNPSDQLKIGNNKLRLSQSEETPASIPGIPPSAVITIGREVDNNLVINEPKVSRNHARLEKQGDLFYLTDLNSSHGTYLNGKRIKGSVAITPASWIQICGINYYFDGVNLKTEQGSIAATLAGVDANRSFANLFVGSNRVLFAGAAAAALIIVGLVIYGFAFNGSSDFEKGSLDKSILQTISADQDMLLSKFGLPSHYLVLVEYDNTSAERYEVWAYPEVQYYYAFLDGDYLNGDHVIFPKMKVDKYSKLSPVHFQAWMNSAAVVNIVGEQGLEYPGVPPADKMISFGNGSLICFFNEQDLLIAVYRSIEVPREGIN